MNATNSEITARVKESLKLFEKTVEREPIIFIDAKGEHLINDFAKEFISKKGIPKKEFVEWLKIGSSHLQNLRYGDIGIHMMKLPGKNVIAFLRQERRKIGVEKHQLTHKEKEVLRHLIKGLSNKRIAENMKIAPGTVNTHLDGIYSKLGCSNRLTACFMALKSGLFLPTCEPLQ